MRGYASRTAVDLHGTVRNLYVNTLPGVLVRTRVPVILKDDMVVDVYLPSIDPRGDLIRDRRQLSDPQSCKKSRSSAVR